MNADGFLARVRERLDVLGLTASAACKAAGLNPGFLRDIQRRQHAPGIDKLQKLAEVLQCSPAFLLGAAPAGLSEVAGFLAPPPGAPMLPPIEASRPEDDEGYAELLDAAETMLAEEGEVLPARRFAELALRLWSDFQDLPASEPVAARVATVVEQRRRMLRAARLFLTGPARATR